MSRLPINIEAIALRYGKTTAEVEAMLTAPPVVVEFYNCQHCKDRRFVRQELSYDVDGFGKPVPCSHCNDFNQRRQQEAVNALQGNGMDSLRGSHQTFANFNKIPATRPAYEAMLKFASAPSKQWVYLWGSTGCGKSHLAAAAKNMLINRGHRVIMQTWPSLMKRVKQSFNGEEDTAKLLKAINEVDVLIIDDLMAGNVSQYDLGELFDTTDYRYNNFLPTVIVSNLPPQQIPEFRVKSRILDKSLVTVIHNKGIDYRQTNHNAL